MFTRESEVLAGENLMKDSSFVPEKTCLIAELSNVLPSVKELPESAVRAGRHVAVVPGVAGASEAVPAQEDCGVNSERRTRVVTVPVVDFLEVTINRVLRKC